MSLNCEEINQIIEKIPAAMMIRKVTEEEYGCFYLYCMAPDESSVILQINLHDGESGLFVVPNKISAEQKQRRFSSFLSNRLSGGRIESITQPNDNRIVLFSIKTISQQFYLIARLWGTASNLLLTDTNFVIEDLARRYPKREEWVGDKFIMPTSTENKKTFCVRDGIVNVNDELFYYYQNLRNNKEFSLLQKRLVEKLTKQLCELQSSIKHLQNELDSDKAEQLRHMGDLIVANIYRLKKGDASAEVEDYETGETVIIPLDEKLSPQENSKRYFEKYKKLQAAFTYQKEKLDESIATFDDTEALLSHIKEADTLQELYELAALAGENFDNKKTNLSSHAGRKFLLSGDFVAYVSRSSRDADAMLKSIARGNDYWFHIRDNAGSHVVIKNKGNVELPDKTRLEAAMLALHFSKSRNEAEGDIYFTRVKYLHKPNSNTPGLVFPTQEKNIKIKKQPEILQRLLTGCEK
jgi:predicted ribosome quality control (RQC) complex YloA/Tae2 family protein